MVVDVVEEDGRQNLDGGRGDCMLRTTQVDALGTPANYILKSMLINVGRKKTSVSMTHLLR